MDLRLSAADEAFRAEARDWLTTKLAGAYADIRGRGGPGDEHSLFPERLAWSRSWAGPAGSGSPGPPSTGAGGCPSSSR